MIDFSKSPLTGEPTPSCTFSSPKPLSTHSQALGSDDDDDDDAAHEKVQEELEADPDFDPDIDTASEGTGSTGEFEMRTKPKVSSVRTHDKLDHYITLT